MKDGGPAIKVRTVRPEAEGERWSATAIKDIAATPDIPNPKDDSQKDPGANAMREAWTLVFREGSFFQSSV